MPVTAIEAALEALTDVVLFITIYAAVVTTVYAIGEPRTKGEVMGRAVALWMCAVSGAVLIVWLLVGILVRVGLITHVG